MLYSVLQSGETRSVTSNDLPTNGRKWEKHLPPNVSNAHLEHTLSNSVFIPVLVVCIQIASQHRS